MNEQNIMNRFQPFVEKMQAEGIPNIAIRNFERHYQELLAGNTGFISESSISPLTNLPDATKLTERHQEIGAKYLSQTALIKLNGGLGTSMGLEKAKSLITVKDGLSFLDLIARHAIQAQVQLLLMNSFSTRDDSLNALQSYQELQNTKLELDFLQHKVPKVNQEDFTPVISGDNSKLEWCPPGHGDIYIALASSGMLQSLLDSGYKYALISNADNLGATLDSSLLGYVVEQKIPFLMEVTERTNMDKKGGHLAARKDGGLTLREAAQCSEQDRQNFEDIGKHQYFNTNNLWIDLAALNDTLLNNDYVLDLALIRNSKTLDPRKSDSTPVYQLESAMGAAISIFEGAQAIRVPRSRFAPVKTTNELLLVRSDIYELNEKEHTLSCRVSQQEMPVIKLDKDYYKLIDDFESRFPYGPPSLLNCQALSIKGDICFGKGIILEGEISLENTSNTQVMLPDNTSISNNASW